MSLQPFGCRVVLYYTLKIIYYKYVSTSVHENSKKIINLQHGKAAIVRENKFKVEA